ncbi:hypothetical protein GS503_21690 [Rhodococcus hoagii]|nr:hypothetical protein [Prescottella equi]NKR71633.1 hypothetical protein [Prescottella equi]
MIDRRLTVTAVTSAVLVAITASACGTDEFTPAEPPKQWSVSFRWDDSDPAIDLSASAIRAIRGAVESDDIEVGIGREYTYPGYLDAAGNNRTMGNKTWTDDPADPVGTLHLRIVLGEVTPTSVDAVVCRDETGITRGANGQYPMPPTTQTFGLWATRVAVEMSESVHQTAPESSASPRVDLREPVLPTMTGPPGRSPRPGEDVFGDWKVTEYEGDFSTTTRNLCKSWLERRWGGQNSPAPARTESEPPTIEPFHPGW